MAQANATEIKAKPRKESFIAALMARLGKKAPSINSVEVDVLIDIRELD